MATKRVHQQIDEFDDRNLWFHALLGLISIDDRIGVAVEGDGPDAASADSALEPTAEDDEGRELIVDALLGVIALRHQLARALASVPAEAERRPRETSTESADDRRSRLDDLLR